MPKVCSKPWCKRLAEDKFKACQQCRDINNKTRRKRRERATKATARDGYRYCTGCFREFSLSHFTSSHNRRKALTAWCATCRASVSKLQRKKTTKKGKCKQVWVEWKKDKSCELCNYKGDNIEADHRPDRGKKIHNCGDYAFWSWNGGVLALEAELQKCRPLCRFCHRLVSQQERGTLKHPTMLKKKAYVDKIKLKIGECQLCKRKVLQDQCCAFDFDHIDAKLKQDGICKMVISYSLKRFKQCIDLEIAKCRLICCMCHRDHTRKQRREKTLAVQELALSIKKY